LTPATTPVSARWAEHHAQLRRLVSRRVSDRHAVDDIVQDVYLKARASEHQLRSADRAAAWLSRIATNLVIDHHRARRPTEELPDDLAAPEAEDDPVVALALCLPGMIGRLADDYRVALHLSEIDGIPQREVAQRLGLSLSGAKSRVQRARVMLRHLVEQCCRVVMSGQRIEGFERIDSCPEGSTGHCTKGLRPNGPRSVKADTASHRPQPI